MVETPGLARSSFLCILSGARHQTRWVRGQRRPSERSCLQVELGAARLVPCPLRQEKVFAHRSGVESAANSEANPSSLPPSSRHNPRPPALRSAPATPCPPDESPAAHLHRA